MFKGKVQIENDSEKGSNFIAYVGQYRCALCGKEGVQRLSGHVDNFPDGITDEDVAQAMLDCIEINHKCLLINTAPKATA